MSSSEPSLFGSNPDHVRRPPFETDDLRSNLQRFLDSPFEGDPSGARPPVGNYRWGVYAFFDYDGEPIYVGQTNEQLRTRIRRHLTNQRTDAVAMSVLDPFEVFEIEVWPLPQFQTVSAKDKVSAQPAKAHLDGLERLITAQAIANSRFKAILNEKDPPPGALQVEAPPSFRDRIVSPRVHELRAHPDFRIARRALIISRLAQVISERQVKGGLRRVLLTQAKRLQWLAGRRYEATGGAASVPTEAEPEDEE
ncbi:GIY-YIG nuclease family protein [Phenylobacterium sp. J426]|uniref:GIY-YIG nuclease family protein n=1 Tax=Phenylobacterium sp. J426 TaxID=2898439 RepID=UPI002150A892|nr:GIY-YIG nuclease family protein [Phenylobacterium sp. J426]MCR5876892.1 GIY-YIG nuclease family protein [Phenylobacterium sp. J426]